MRAENNLKLSNPVEAPILFACTYNSNSNTPIITQFFYPFSNRVPSESFRGRVICTRPAEVLLERHPRLQGEQAERPAGGLSGVLGAVELLGTVSFLDTSAQAACALQLLVRKLFEWIHSSTVILPSSAHKSICTQLESKKFRNAISDIHESHRPPSPHCHVSNTVGFWSHSTSRNLGPRLLPPRRFLILSYAAPRHKGGLALPELGWLVFLVTVLRFLRTCAQGLGADTSSGEEIGVEAATFSERRGDSFRAWPTGFAAYRVVW